MYLIPDLRPIGSGHRSGWPPVVAAIRRHSQDRAIGVDDFVDRTFSEKPSRRRIYRDPWVGIVHHPPNMPLWLQGMKHPQALVQTEEWIASRPQLRGLVALSDYLATWLRTEVGCPVTTLRYPCSDRGQSFSLTAFRTAPTLVQTGWYLKNQWGIYQVPVPAGVTKVHVTSKFTDVARRYQEQGAALMDRALVGETVVSPPLSNGAYDRLLRRAVLFAEFFDVSASTVVVEALARATPIFCNRHPALEEYLGPDYPLFFSAITEVPDLWARIPDAHAYLLARPMAWLNPVVFVKGLRTFTGAVA